ncbi:hypothetical protein R3P38DRAFT_2923944 [Favolaschia claudopus]|uniref:BRCT domain-containing protein n=1 Tax=Favolaschia claudopus TaxID=2862362 RepID=A0AAW0BX86_9AGAR
MLFNGLLACFSPSVHASLRSAWVKHGGSLTVSKQEFYQANVFFCDGLNDPWLKELLSRSLIVRHAKWISKSVSEQFAVPVSKFLLDDQFDPAKLEVEPNLLIRTPLAPSSKPIEPLNPRAAERVPRPAAKLPTLKRAFDSENRDDSATDINLRPLKRARLHLAPSPQSIADIPSSSRVTSPPPLFPTPTPPARTEILYPPTSSIELAEPASRNVYETSHPTKHNPRRIDFTALDRTPTLPQLSFPRRRPAALANSNVAETYANEIASQAQSRPCKLRLSVSSIARAPSALAHWGAYVSSDTYQGRPLVCRKIGRQL